MTTQTADANGSEFTATDFQPGQVFQTLTGERVEIVSDDGPFQKPLKVRFPEREPQLDADGEERDHHVQFMSRYAFADAANFEGYTLISEDGPTAGEDSEDEVPNLAGEWTDETPRCPVCGSFMSTGFDGQGLPSAQCSGIDCHGFMDDRELIDGGYFSEGDR